jgi:hypothetical protein
MEAKETAKESVRSEYPVRLRETDVKHCGPKYMHFYTVIRSTPDSKTRSATRNCRVVRRTYGQERK